jgi:hypothetical protein
MDNRRHADFPKVAKCNARPPESLQRAGAYVELSGNDKHKENGTSEPETNQYRCTWSRDGERGSISTGEWLGRLSCPECLDIG